ncbi:hypothetical protein GCM10009801_74320 [Streptomyces albiaxialis]|uniref:Uncharacterized protein n=1 Tax=Streptomyces albiaxialis TaxID=329523 RepID=A0ABN2WYS0_9ACTN
MQRSGVDGLERVQVDHPHREALRREFVGGPVAHGPERGTPLTAQWHASDGSQEEPRDRDGPYAGQQMHRPGAVLCAEGILSPVRYRFSQHRARSGTGTGTPALASSACSSHAPGESASDTRRKGNPSAVAACSAVVGAFSSVRPSVPPPPCLQRPSTPTVRGVSGRHFRGRHLQHRTSGGL